MDKKSRMEEKYTQIKNLKQKKNLKWSKMQNGGKI